MFQFVPLHGALTDARVSSSLLLFDNGIKILVDCGWSEPFNVEDLAELEKHTPTISIILLTHPTLSHLGAYAHCCAHIPLFSQIPVYCTYPVASLGRTLLQDVYLSNPLIHTFVPTDDENAPKVLLTPPSSDDIDRYFDAMHLLKYSQSFPFPAPLTGLVITASRAGHTLGGTIWRIEHLQERVIFSVDWNHARDAHLASAAFLPSATGAGRISDEFIKPTAMICSTRNALPSTLSLPRKRRDDTLLSTIRKVALEGGTVLIPTDSSARMLELAYILEHDYRKPDTGWQGSSVVIALACRTAGRTLRFVKSSLEWMDESMVREFESTDAGADGKRNRNGGEDKTNAGPYDFKYLKIVEKRQHLQKILRSRSGTVIIASDRSLDWGFSKDVLSKIAQDPRNLIVLTERMEFGSSIGTTLWKYWQEQDGQGESAMGTLRQINNIQYSLPMHQRIPLTPAELQIYQQNLLAQQAHLSTHLPGQSATADNQLVGEDESDSESSSESEDDADDPKQGKTLLSSHANPMRKLLSTVEDMGVTILIKSKNIYDFDARNARGRNRMFPFIVTRKKGDEFGEVLRAEDYMRMDERGEASNDENGAGGEKLEIFGIGSKGDESREYGKKRKWDHVNNNNSRDGSNNNRSDRRLSTSGQGNKRRKPLRGKYQSNNHDGDEEMEEDDEEVFSSDSDVEDASTPCKLITTTTSITFSALLTYIDFEGLHDSRSLRMLLPLIKPRKLILVGGNISETESLARDVQPDVSMTSSTDMQVFTPVNGEVIDASVDTDAWSLKLSDKLVKALKWQNVRGLGVVHVVGRVFSDDQGMADNNAAVAVVKDENAMDESKDVTVAEDGIPSNSSSSTSAAAQPPAPKPLILDVLPATLSAQTRTSTQSIHVGDIRLTDLRRVLVDGGHTAEFRGEGTLLCDDVVAIKKEGVGKISVEDSGFGGLEGRLSKFWNVRKKVYEGLAVVSGA